MKKVILAVLIATVSLLMACKEENKCPENVNYGLKTLDQPSKFFFPYGKQSLTIYFKNAKKDSIKIATDNQQYNVLTVNDTVLCGDGIDPFNSQFGFHTTENIRHVWAGTPLNTTLNALVQLGVENAYVKDSSYYDKMIVRMTVLGVTSGFDLILFNKGKAIDPKITALVNQFRYVGDTTWNGRNFKEVYYSLPNKVDSSAIFYNKTFGIVGLKFKDDIWVYDRVE